jgi:plasmid stabilization system protein ParE
VARVVCSAHWLDALEGALTRLRERDAGAAPAAAAAIASAVGQLGAHPLAGKRIAAELRELVVSYGPTGFVAVYRFVALRDEVRLLAIRGQRELGYRP